MLSRVIAKTSGMFFLRHSVYLRIVSIQMRTETVLLNQSDYLSSIQYKQDWACKGSLLHQLRNFKITTR